MHRSASELTTQIDHDYDDDDDDYYALGTKNDRLAGRKRTRILSDEDDHKENNIDRQNASKCGRRRWSSTEQEKVFGAF
jgi:hypothetical protein